MNVHVIATDWKRHGDALRRVRESVFIEEQGVAREEEWDGFDETSRHFIALNEAGQAIGTARLLPTGQIGRMAVLATHRRRGIGRRLLDAAVEAAHQAGHDRVFLHAQTQAIPFYREAGFDVVGPEFMEAGIAHREMVRLLPIEFTSANPPSHGWVNPPASADIDARSELVVFDDEGACRRALYDLIEGARRTLRVVNPDLDPRLFATSTCVELLSRFARRAAVSKLRILVEDGQGIAGSGHRLLELARRLPSKIEIRRLSTDLPEPLRRSFAVADDRAIWVVPDVESPAGFANRYDRVEAGRLTEEFDRLFDRGTEDPELRLITL